LLLLGLNLLFPLPQALFPYAEGFPHEVKELCIQKIIAINSVDPFNIGRVGKITQIPPVDARDFILYLVL